jgi:hypothetical protein
MLTAAGTAARREQLIRLPRMTHSKVTSFRPMQKAHLPSPVLLCLATFLSLTILSGLQLFIFHLSHPLIDSLDLLFPGLWKGWDILCFQGRFYYFGTPEFF